MVEEGEMPLEDYTYFGTFTLGKIFTMATSSKLKFSWPKDQMAMLAATYPGR